MGANPDHLKMLHKGVKAWNAWRAREPQVRPDLLGLNAYEAMLLGVDFSKANLRWTSFQAANLTGANLTGADLTGADLVEANLTEAVLTGANLTGANLVEAKLMGADLTGCRIYGISVWNVALSEDTKQRDLIITPKDEVIINNEPDDFDADEPEITVDNIEVAQFVYLLLHNAKIRDVIDTITSKAVLILGRFTKRRKVVLDALRDDLRRRGYLPILFDFAKPASRTTDETITLLARMARFVIADISDAKSVLQELRSLVPELPSVPVQPVILARQEEPGMFDFHRRFPSFLPVHRYKTASQLLSELSERVIDPAEAKVLELRAATAPSPPNPQDSTLE